MFGHNFFGAVWFGLASIASAAGPQYPAKPIHLIVPYAVGGGTDISARVIARHLEAGLGQPVIVENRPGAGTLLGSAIVARAAPDGYTLLYGSVTHAIAPAMVRERMPFDAVRDFTPITQVAVFPFVVVARPALGAANVQALVAQARARPGELTYASVGNGTGTHLAGELFKRMTATDLVHVPYNGSGPALAALLGGHVQIAISDPPPALAAIRHGELRALAVTTLHRSPALPDVPTLDESGLRGFDVASWWGVFAPAKLPDAILQRLNEQLVEALKQPDVRAALASFAAEPVGSSPAQFGTLVKAEVAKFRKLVDGAGVRLD